MNKKIFPMWIAKAIVNRFPMTGLNLMIILFAHGAAVNVQAGYRAHSMKLKNITFRRIKIILIGTGTALFAL